VRGLIAHLCTWLLYAAQMRLSNMELTLVAILTLKSHALGNEAFSSASRHMGSALLKPSDHYGFLL
jgi:hypothetical protein